MFTVDIAITRPVYLYSSISSSITAVAAGTDIADFSDGPPGAEKAWNAAVVANNNNNMRMFVFVNIVQSSYQNVYSAWLICSADPASGAKKVLLAPQTDSAFQHLLIRNETSPVFLSGI